MDYPYGQKRSANFSPTTPSHPMPSLAQDNNGPRILRHHRHRRRNIAASVWGIETPPPPSTPASSSAPDSTLPAAYRSFSGPRAAFNIYKSLLRHPNLFFQFCIRLPCLAVEGHRVPHLAFAVLCKFWGLMECKTTKLREAFLQDVGIWSSEEILIFQLFMVKLDMRFSDPILGNGIGELSHMLLTQNGLDMLYKVLTGEMRLDYDKVTDILVRTYVSEDFDLDTHPWLDDEIDNGVPEEFWGLLLREGWSVDGKRMESAVDMVITEGIRRGLDVQKYYLDFVLYGFVDEEGNNLPVPRKLCHGSAGKSVEMRWPSEQKRQEVLVSLRELAAAQNTAGPDEMEIDF